MKYLFLALTLAFTLSISLPSCNKQTCPTYATSGPTKSSKKKGSQAGSKQDGKKNRKTAKGKPSTGLF